MSSGRNRVALVRDVDLDDRAALLDAADQLADDGERAEARLIYLALLLRSGAAPDEADWRSHICKRAYLPDLAEEQRSTRGRAGTAVDIAVLDIASILRPGGVEDAAGGRVQGAPAELSGNSLEAAALRLLQAIHLPGSGAAFAELGEALQQLQAAAPPPLNDLGHAALRAYALDVCAFVLPPLGSPSLVHALTRASAAGVGALGLRTGDLARNGREALALLQMGLGRPLATVPDARTALGVLLLAQRAPPWLRRQLVDEVADLGLRAPLRALMDVALRAPEHRRDREFLQRLRDAGLDLGDLQLGWDAQHLLAEGWREDKNEWQALADIAGYRGDFAEAEQLFEKALGLDPELEHARGRLEALRARKHLHFANPGGFGSSSDRRRLRAQRAATPLATAFVEETLTLERARLGCVVAPEIAPGPSPRRCWIPDNGLHLRGLEARRKRSVWGELPTLRGVDAVRGFYVADRPMREVRVQIGGRLLARSAPLVHPVVGDDCARCKSVFNLWIDLSGFAPGRYELTLDVSDAASLVQTHREHVVIEAPPPEEEAAASDAVAPPPTDPAASLEETINARPSQVRPAWSGLFDKAPQRVLVIRADQLGDLVCSIPALQRLRQLLPEAEITGLVTPANAALARSLKLFDDLIVVDFRTDPVERRRLMPVKDQMVLQAELQARRFDLAIDLADYSPSRYLLLLSGAKRLFGMQGGTYGFLDFQFEARARDPFNGSEAASPSRKMLAMVEWLGLSMGRQGGVLRRDDLNPSRLRAFGLDERNYVVLHTGARLQFSRWPHYPALARLLLERTDYQIVFISDEPLSAARLGPGLVGHDRCHLIERALPFDDLDLLLSYCIAFVGNDSGPKHLAALRGSEVISLHCARNNWNEWGQDNTGVIISRRLPCAGCQVRDYPDECGKDYVCMSAISPEEVAQAALNQIQLQAAQPP